MLQIDLTLNEILLLHKAWCDRHSAAEKLVEDGEMLPEHLTASDKMLEKIAHLVVMVRATQTQTLTVCADAPQLVEWANCHEDIRVVEEAIATD